MIETKQINKLQLIIKCLRLPKQQKVLKYVMENDGNQVTTIRDSLGIDQSVCSNALSDLKKAGFVTSIDNDQDARIKNYYVNYSELNRITDIINSL